METSLSLDEIAGLLISLDVNDRPGMKRVRALLSECTAEDSAAADVLNSTVVAITNALAVDDASAVVILLEAGRTLQVAMDSRDSAEDPGMNNHDYWPHGPDASTDTAHRDNVSGHDSPSAGHLPADTDMVLLSEFISESREYLQASEQALLQLEDEPGDPEAINTIFRAFHTIKGTSGFLGLDDVNHFAHHAESLLSAVRDQKVMFSRTNADLALQATDMLNLLLDSVGMASPGGIIDTPVNLCDLQRSIEAASEDGGSKDTQIRTSRRIASGADANSAQSNHLQIVSSADRSPQNFEKMASGNSGASGDSARSAGNSTVRVRTERLDRLIDMMGELVIAQSMIAEDPAVKNDNAQGISRKASHAGKIVRELQELSMSMRMVPLKATFHKMRRLVRDVAHRSSKLVDLIIEGEDTEIDRNMVDVIGDPLVHMVRNAIDHGIENPEARVASGKPATGRLSITASHAGGSVVVEISDDGKGLDRERILKKALANGLLDSDKGLSDGEIYNLIFAPGFSTNDEVTDLSGRGVGMDVVRTNIESIEGRIDIASDPGHGSRFTLRLPLTLAVTDGMFVRVGDERFILPTIHIQFSLRPDAGSLHSFAGQREMVSVRGELLPLLRLHRLFGIEDGIHTPHLGMLVVVNVLERHCAILVDEVLGQQQVVAKPMGEGIGRITGVAGSAILGDGRVGLILDVPELISPMNTATPASRTPGDLRYPTQAAA